jgi:hypothetical protein
MYRDPTILGSAVQHLSINSLQPVLILKDPLLRSRKPGGKYRWAICTDGSEKSIKAFHVLAKLIDKSKDEVEAITVETSTVDIPTV